MNANPDDAGEDVFADLFALDTIGPDRFISHFADCNLNGAIFGGQLIGQAVHAALKTVEPTRPLHALHATFLRPASGQLPLEFAVERLVDGSAFTRRRVLLTQQGRAILTADVSCHAGEAGDNHAHVLQLDVPPPHQLPTMADMVCAAGTRLPPAASSRMGRMRETVEVRIANPETLLARESSHDALAVWLRFARPIPDHPHNHVAAFGFMSDYWMASPFRMLPGALQHTGPITISSLDHAFWIHRPFRADTWLLAINDIPSEQGGRRLNRAQFFDLEGQLVASSVQEQLIRVDGNA
jgi:acyl-CoA thioesterase-2